MPEAMVRLASSPTVPATARNLVDRFGAADTVAGSYDVRLVVSELVSDALQQSDRHVQMVVRRSRDTLRIEVKPAGALRPDAVPDQNLPVGIIQSLADRWGVEPAGPDHVVWCEFSVRRAAQPA